MFRHGNESLFEEKKIFGEVNNERRVIFLLMFMDVRKG